MMYWGFGWGWIGMLLMIVFWVLVVAGAVALIGRLTARSGNYPARANWTPSAPQETPLDILKRHYASGEITKAEYEQKRQDLLSEAR